MNEPVITHDELVAALHDAMAKRPADDPGLTTQELCMATKWSVTRVRNRLLELKASGRVRCGVRYEENLAGRMSSRPVYMIVGVSDGEA